MFESPNIDTCAKYMKNKAVRYMCKICYWILVRSHLRTMESHLVNFIYVQIKLHFVYLMKDLLFVCLNFYGIITIVHCYLVVNP